MKELYTLIAIIGVLGLLYALKCWIDLAKEKKKEVEDKRVGYVFDRITDFAETAVNKADEKIVKVIKENPDKIWDENTQRKVFEGVLETIKSWLSSEQMRTLEKYLESSEKVDGYIGEKIESEVNSNKKSDKNRKTDSVK